MVLSINTVIDVLVGLVIGVVFASKQLFQGNMNNVLSAGLTTGLLIIIGMRVFYALWRGFSFVLWRTKKIPLNLLQLLEAATTSVLMHKAGGGYLFIHRFLRDYFASLDKKTPPSKELERLVRHL